MGKEKVEKKELKKVVKYKIVKKNGNVILRDTLGKSEIKRYESKGWKVEGV